MYSNISCNVDIIYCTHPFWKSALVEKANVVKLS